ncbi:hypothetical protein UR09_03865 [Candidatus Nitromaritima sp. SCGC AAA799-A02]|nr:hypothetical protein UZ36_06070 [Candidatus Nitromaritima sp. SCGC AAA799-C22]KMP11235.1 hypothetical protein UR09_03865 [Candidatus Nitromaritima sp. SCGC AAA799-A02]
MTLFDIIVVIVLGLCFLFSLFKGMVREVFSLAGYAAGYVLAINFQDTLAAAMKDMVTQPIAARIAAFAIIFIAVKFGFTLIGKLIRKSMEGTAVLSLPDRLLGGALGLVKGLVILSILMFPLSLFEDTYDKATQGSVLAPHLEKIVQVVHRTAKERKLLDRLPDFSMDDVKEKLGQMESLDKLSEEVKKAKEKIFNSGDGKPQEDYTPEDKKKLDDLLDILNKE